MTGYSLYNYSFSRFRPLFVCIVIVLYLSVLRVTAQTVNSYNHVVDSLNKELLKNYPDSIRFNILMELTNSMQWKEPYEALNYAKEALKVVKSDYYKAIMLTRIGFIYKTVSNYPQALSYYFQALKIYESMDDEMGRVRLFTNIAVCYIDLKRYTLAEKYIDEAVRIKEKAGYDNDLGMLYSNLGVISTQQGNLYKAIQHYEKAAEINRKNQHQEAVPVNNLGDIYVRLEDYLKAEYYYKKALEVSQNEYELVGSCISLGELFIKQQRFDEAAKYLFKAKKIAENSSVGITADVLYTIAFMYEQQKDYKNANIYYKQYYALKDSSLNETTARQINELQIKYEFDKKDKELQIAEAKVEKEYLFRNFLITAFVFAVITGFVIIRNIILKQRMKNKILSERNVKLLHDNTEAKYEILKNKTNPHFLFNSLTTLSSLIINDSEKAIEYVEHFSELYRSILNTGERKMLSLKYEMSLVKNYLYLQKMRFKEDLIVNISVPQNMYHYLLPSLALQMVVENAVKHNIISEKHKLTVSISLEEKKIVVKNNLQLKHSKMASTSTGQKNISERYRLVSDQLPEYIQTESLYIVKLPLLEEQSYTAKQDDIIQKKEKPITDYELYYS